MAKCVNNMMRCEMEEEIESLRQQLAIAERTTDEVQKYADGVRDDLRQQLAECQAELKLAQEGLTIAYMSGFHDGKKKATWEKHQTVAKELE